MHNDCLILFKKFILETPHISIIFPKSLRVPFKQVLIKTDSPYSSQKKRKKKRNGHKVKVIQCWLVDQNGNDFSLTLTQKYFGSS
jgi:hypothetical protein